MHTHSLEELVAQVPIFSQLKPDELREVAARVRLRRHPSGTQLFRAGGDNPNLMIIHSGWVKVYRLAESGHEQVVRVLGVGDFLGEATFMSDRTADNFAVTLQDSEICSLHRDDMRDYLLRSPSVAYKMLKTLSSRLESTESQLSSVTGEEAGHRVAGYLTRLADESGTGRVTLPISKKDVASYLGMTPETFSRRLAAFEEAGWLRLLGNRRVDVLDESALARV
jgi:CRP/FNR family transcriptional regulator